MNYLCINCGEEFETKSAKKSHKKKRCAFRDPKVREETENEYGSKEGAIAAFECVAEDLPDGAYFAMAEEFGLEPEDLMN